LDRQDFHQELRLAGGGGCRPRSGGRGLPGDDGRGRGELGCRRRGRVVGSDVHYKGRGAEIVEECMVLQARQAPVARDLRLVHTAQAVTNHLLRTGTLCEHICGTIVETADVERDPDLQATILEMSSIARDLFREGLDVFDNRDILRVS
jgi:phosphate transport system protein